MASVAAVTLLKARFFVEQANRADPNDRAAFTNYLEAAIVFARSVTFHLQKQFATAAGFNEWYAKQQKRLAEDQLSRFLLHQRNYVLKEGPVTIRRIVEVEMTTSNHIAGSFSVRIIRGKPWYRRSPKILFEDAIDPVREWLHEWRQRRAASNAAHAHRQTPSSAVRDALYFNDSEWAETPAIELLRRQLDLLEEIVRAAEARFLAKGTPNNGV